MNMVKRTLPSPGRQDSGPGPGRPSPSIGLALAQANIACDASFLAAVGDRSVTRLRYALLDLVGARPGLQQVQLAELLGLSRSGLTLLTDYWQGRGMVERRQKHDDRRSFGVHLTAQGSDYLSTLRERVADHETILASPLTRAEREQLVALLRKVAGDRE